MINNNINVKKKPTKKFRVEKSKVEGVGVVFEHDHIESLWKKYHQSIATYSCLCRSCNSRKGAR